MPMIIVKDQLIAVDKEGYLVELKEWSKAVAEILAKTDNLLLTEDHWQVIYYLREFHSEYQTTPAVRILVKELAKLFGPEKGNSIYLHQLFPNGLLKQASKIAGLPKPTRCT